MDMDFLNNRPTEDETLEQAYDIFLELAADNLIVAELCRSIFSLKSAAARSYSIRRKTGRNMLISI
ncbi:DUF440 family protein [Escherichia coli]